MTANKNKRKSILLNDECVAWYENQDNASVSLKLLITQAIKKYGNCDLIESLTHDVNLFDSSSTKINNNSDDEIDVLDINNSNANNNDFEQIDDNIGGVSNINEVAKPVTPANSVSDTSESDMDWRKVLG